MHASEGGRESGKISYFQKEFSCFSSSSSFFPGRFFGVSKSFYAYVNIPNLNTKFRCKTIENYTPKNESRKRTRQKNNHIYLPSTMTGRKRQRSDIAHANPNGNSAHIHRVMQIAIYATLEFTNSPFIYYNTHCYWCTQIILYMQLYLHVRTCVQLLTECCVHCV